jgi:hypothetical protein
MKTVSPSRQQHTNRQEYISPRLAPDKAHTEAAARGSGSGPRVLAIISADRVWQPAAVPA